MWSSSYLVAEIGCTNFMTTISQDRNHKSLLRFPNAGFHNLHIPLVTGKAYICSLSWHVACRVSKQLGAASVGLADDLHCNYSLINLSTWIYLLYNGFHPIVKKQDKKRRMS